MDCDPQEASTLPDSFISHPPPVSMAYSRCLGNNLGEYWIYEKQEGNEE